MIIDFATAAQLFENNTASVQFIDEFNQIALWCHFPKAVKDDKAAQLFEKHTERHFSKKQFWYPPVSNF